MREVAAMTCRYGPAAQVARLFQVCGRTQNRRLSTPSGTLNLLRVSLALSKSDTYATWKVPVAAVSPLDRRSMIRVLS